MVCSLFESILELREPNTRTIFAKKASNMATNKVAYIGTVLGTCVGAWLSCDLAKSKVQHDAPKLDNGFWYQNDEGDWHFQDYEGGDIVGMVEKVTLNAELE